MITMLESDKIIREKIEKVIELVCPLYKNNLITDAYIIGSVAKGETSKYSDIDIYIINPDFKKQKYSYDIQLIPDFEGNAYTNNIVQYLKELGVEFRYLSIKNAILWLGLYKDEIFHFSYTYKPEYVEEPYIRITIDLCQ